MIIFHNPRCKKSRAGLAYLSDKGIDTKVVNYLKDQPFTTETLDDLLIKMNKQPLEIIRTQEKEFKELFKGKSFDRKQWIEILVKHPRLIQRPIISNGKQAVIGDPVENIEVLL